MSKKNFQTNNIEIEVKFKEFKLGDKIGYYLKLEDINYYLNKKDKMIVKPFREIKRNYGSPYVIHFDNHLYISQFGFEKYLENYRGNKKSVAAKLILGKFRDKNMKENNIWRPKEKGLQPVVSNNIIFRVIDKEIFISTNSIVEKTGIGLNDLNSKCKREYYFDKDNVRIGTSDKKKNISSYLLSEIAYRKLVGLDNKEIFDLYSKEIK